MSEPTFTDEQIKAIREELRSHAIDTAYPAEIRDVLAAALAQGVVALPKANVEDARVQATIENLKCWAEEWDETGMSHEAALCRQMAETVERLAAERQDVASPRSAAPGAQGGRLTEVGGDHKRATAVSDGHEPSALQGSVHGALIAEEVYNKCKSWKAQFDGFVKEGRTPKDYYAGMASGLNIALQEIDRERYDREERP